MSECGAVAIRCGVLVTLMVGAIGCGSAETPAPRTARTSHALETAPAPEPPAEDDLGLDPDQIQPVVLKKYGLIGGCHSLEYGGKPNAVGSMTLDWVINPDGSVSDVSIVESSFENERMEQCVLEVASTLTFPRAGGSTPVSWRFKFRASEDGTASVQ